MFFDRTKGSISVASVISAQLQNTFHRYKNIDISKKKKNIVAIERVSPDITGDMHIPTIWKIFIQRRCCKQKFISLFYLAGRRIVYVINCIFKVKLNFRAGSVHLINSGRRTDVLFVQYVHVHARCSEFQHLHEAKKRRICRGCSWFWTGVYSAYLRIRRYFL